MAVSIQHSAGGIVFRLRNGHYEVLMIKDSYGRWTFPKGHVEGNETLEETATREIAEETSLEEVSLQRVTELGEIDYWFTSSFDSDKAAAGSGQEPATIHKYVTYYLFEAPADSFPKPQAGEVEAIEWVSLADIDDYNGYEDNEELIEKTKGLLTALTTYLLAGEPAQ